jgi:hypothetical protein
MVVVVLLLLLLLEEEKERTKRSVVEEQVFIRRIRTAHSDWCVLISHESSTHSR